MRRFQEQFAQGKKFRHGFLVVGEGIAVAAAIASVIPQTPDAVAQIAMPTAILVGAGALLLVAIFDFLDPTVPTMLHYPRGGVPEKAKTGANFITEAEH